MPSDQDGEIGIIAHLPENIVRLINLQRSHSFEV